MISYILAKLVVVMVTFWIVNDVILSTRVMKGCNFIVKPCIIQYVLLIVI